MIGSVQRAFYSGYQALRNGSIMSVRSNSPEWKSAVELLDKCSEEGGVKAVPEQELIKKVESGAARVFLFQHDSAVVGCALVSRSDGALQFDQFYIKKRLRNQGRGRGLEELLVEEGKKEGVQSVRMILPPNLEDEGFCVNLGYERVSEKVFEKTL